MIDNILTISKLGIKSVYTVAKYDEEILDEDLSSIVFIRNYIEECSLYVKESRKDINTAEYLNELKNYALELFLIQCEEALPDAEKESDDFDLEVYQKESIDYFNFIYNNLKYPE